MSESYAVVGQIHATTAPLSIGIDDLSETDSRCVPKKESLNCAGDGRLKTFPRSTRRTFAPTYLNQLKQESESVKKATWGD